ncbi:MAG TPA: hypothetical protein VJS43_07100 [Candidatus Acidoferrales bacterium]|nr:hypothetical protein [Candidatus Acidoferrales bacterium]
MRKNAFTGPRSFAARWNTQGILNISYHTSQPDLEETYAALLSTFRFL